MLRLSKLRLRQSSTLAALHEMVINNSGNFACFCNYLSRGISAYLMPRLHKRLSTMNFPPASWVVFGDEESNQKLREKCFMLLPFLFRLYGYVVHAYFLLITYLKQK